MAATKARDIMSPDCSCIGESDTVLDAARRLAELAAPRRGRILALGEHLHDDVAVGQHPLEPVVLTADRHRADVQLGQPLRRVEHRVVLADALGAPGHHLSGCLAHSRLLRSCP